MAAIVGIELHYGFEYVTHCTGEEGKPLAVFHEIGSTIPLAAPACETLRGNNYPSSSFDLLIAADGTCYTLSLIGTFYSKIEMNS